MEVQRAVSESVSACGSLDSIRILVSQLDRCPSLPGKQKKAYGAKALVGWLVASCSISLTVRELRRWCPRRRPARPQHTPRTRTRGLKSSEGGRRLRSVANEAVQIGTCRGADNGM
jgi:hypothetical protein